MEIPYDWRCCTICQCTYSCNVFLSDQESSGNDSHRREDNNRVIPVKSAVCDHTLCLSCVEQQSLILSNNNKDLEDQHPTVTCPICKKADAFSADEPTISLVTCKLLKKEAERLSRKPNDCKRTPSENERTNNNNISAEKTKDIESNQQGDSKSNN